MKPIITKEPDAWIKMFLEGKIADSVFEALPIPEEPLIAGRLARSIKMIIAQKLAVNAQNIIIFSKDAEVLCHYIDLVNDIDNKKTLRLSS